MVLLGFGCKKCVIFLIIQILRSDIVNAGLDKSSVIRSLKSPTTDFRIENLNINHAAVALA